MVFARSGRRVVGGRGVVATPPDTLRLAGIHLMGAARTYGLRARPANLRP